jgi:hypothetical protein
MKDTIFNRLKERGLSKSLIDEKDIRTFIDYSIEDIKVSISFLKKLLIYVGTSYKYKFTNQELSYAFSLPSIDLLNQNIFRGILVSNENLESYLDEEIPTKYYQKGQFSSWTRNKKVTDYFMSESGMGIGNYPILLRTKVDRNTLYLSPEFIELLMLKTIHYYENILHLDYYNSDINSTLLSKDEYKFFTFLEENTYEIGDILKLNEEEIMLFADDRQVVVEIE